MVKCQEGTSFDFTFSFSCWEFVSHFLVHLPVGGWQFASCSSSTTLNICLSSDDVSSCGQIATRCVDVVAFSFPRLFPVLRFFLQLDGGSMTSSLSGFPPESSDGLSAKAFVMDFSAFLDRFWLAVPSFLKG